MKVFAHHGALPQEQATGANFYVTLRAQVEMEKSAYEEDQLEGTVDYSILTQIVQMEMKIPSKLLEHVATRIGKKILSTCPTIHQITVHIEKENPPLGIQC